LEHWVSFDSVETSAHGDYAVAEHGVATTTGEMAFADAPTITSTACTVKGLAVLNRAKVAHAAVGIVSHSAVGNDEPLINLGNNVLDGVEIDGCKLKVTLAEDFFKTNNTLKKLRDAFNAGLDPKYQGLFLTLDGSEPPPTKFPEANGTVKCTVVQKLEWDGPAHQTATIHNHVVAVPDFGNIYFGEMFVKADARRLTMVRFQLGCPDGGDVVAADSENNGGGYPPDGQ
jgi:hypothetical protein